MIESFGDSWKDELLQRARRAITADDGSIFRVGRSGGGPLLGSFLSLDERTSIVHEIYQNGEDDDRLDMVYATVRVPLDGVAHKDWTTKAFIFRETFYRSGRVEVVWGDTEVIELQGDTLRDHAIRTVDLLRRRMVLEDLANV